ncbi:helix-turn-helix domain-containing protein [Streptomyces sp. NBC_00199]|uniref:helix-turn-helix domain-containing protein n=1 Tax=Streptomyces sp. NBC_00199 TaxID=2975678 RepID=UPI0022582C00|nr:helix-turn-helix domain-containing protein [Streptomyces sp. NBC_00199]MCX5266072.1 helix-turn-helix domain-containing protein [Streptomyces sp. NBC_00199]
MATTNPTGRLTPAERRRRVRQLAAENKSNREIARQLGIHHRTVARDLDAPPAPAEAPQIAPPAPTSGDPRAPRLLHPLEPALIQDLNCLADPRTGALPEPIRRIIRAAADGRRADMLAAARRIADEEERQPSTGRGPVRAQVAP